MKNLLTVSLLIISSVLFITACVDQKENDLLTSFDETQERTAQPALPDLIVSSITSSLPITNGPCPGGTMANATCGGPGGQVNFTFTVTIENITSIAIPAGTCIDVDICLDTGGCSTLSAVTCGMAGNSSFTVTSPLYALPCPSGQPPYILVERQFYAVVDPMDAINEFRENNNFSNRYFVCDDDE